MNRYCRSCATTTVLIRENRQLISENIRLRRSLAERAAQSSPVWMTCTQCEHQWQVTIEAPPGELCGTCEGNQAQTDEHHSAELIQKFKAVDSTRPVRGIRHASAQKGQDGSSTGADKGIETETVSLGEIK